MRHDKPIENPSKLDTSAAQSAAVKSGDAGLEVSMAAIEAAIVNLPPAIREAILTLVQACRDNR